MSDANVKQESVQIQVLRLDIEKILDKLKDIDSHRIQSLESFHNINEFIRLTNASIAEIRTYLATVEKLMAYVLLVEKEGHRSAQFQDLLQRYKVMEVVIKDILKNRLRQVFYAERLVGTASLRFGSWLNRRMLLYKIKEEDNLITILINLYLRDRDTIEKISRALTWERNKSKLIKSAPFFSPVGTPVLIIIIHLAYSWANQFSLNRKRLRGLLQ